MLIQDVERKTGLDRATIRFYEKENLVIPIREENGYRTYQEHDVELLLKIKLLRQLGVSLSKIKNLQQGSSDFSEILSEQVSLLEHQIKNDTRAMLVCQKMQTDGAQFRNLDVHYYLKLLSAESISVGGSFSESVDRECHPWRRFFARSLDYSLIGSFLNIFIIGILRIRPFDSDASDIVIFLSRFAAIPILATMLHYWGTTPGKWVMGIRLESIHGGKLSGGEALYREGKIIWHGLGFFLPFVQIWRYYRSYRQEMDGIIHPWNEDSEVIYEKWSGSRKCIAALFFAISFTLSVLAGCDSVMPTYRSEGITIEEFAENFRDYEKLLYHECEYIMTDEGKWRNNENYIVDIALEAVRPNFVYKTNENGEITSISYENSFKSDYPRYILPEYCRVAICAAIGSRPGSTYYDITRIDEILETMWYSQLPQQGGVSQGSFQVSDVTISWDAVIENCKFISHGSLFASDNSVLSYDLKFDIQFGS